MTTQIFKNTGWFLLLLLLQVLVFNHIHIAGYAMPLVYVYFLLIVPSHTPHSLLIAWGFVAGIVFDTFANTPGVGAAAMTFMGFIQPYLFRLFVSNEDDEEIIPRRKTMGGASFTLYLFVASLLHTSLFFLLEAFSVFNWDTLLINIGGSTLLSTLVMLAIESIRSSLHRK